VRSGQPVLSGLLALVLAAAVADGRATAPADSVAARPDSTAADSPAAVPDSGDGIAPVPYGPGEKLVFSIDYGPVNAGEGTLEITGIIESQGRPCYRIESRAKSNSFFSAFYKVRDKVVSHIDVAGLFSRYFSKRLREGTFKRTVEIEFDHEAGKARYADGREFDTLPGMHDILSAFYYVRTLDLEPGTPHGVMTHSSRKNYSLQVLVHRRERVEVPAGTFDCIVVEPIIEGEGLFQHEGQLTIWLSDDEHRLPVLMKTKVKVGSIDASLKEYTLGRRLTAADLGKDAD
jgi:hypothetical protein